MKRVIILEEKIRDFCSESLLNFTEEAILKVRDAILKYSFLTFSKNEFSIFKNQRHTYLVSKYDMMSAECYNSLMLYFFNEEAFTEEEKQDLLLTTRELSPGELFGIADELLTFRGFYLINVIRETLPNVKEDISNELLLASVRSAFWHFWKQIKH